MKCRKQNRPSLFPGKVWIYRSLFVCVFLCVSVCMDTNFSAEDKTSGVTFCSVVEANDLSGCCFSEIKIPVICVILCFIS